MADLPPADPPADGAARVTALLDVAVAEADRCGRADLAARLARERGTVLNPTCLVLVVGEFKKGKSALINALLNAPVCPSDAQRATAVPTLVRYGPELSAGTLDADGAGRAVPLGDLESLAGADTTGPAARSLQVTVPRELLRHGLTLVDTPGVGGGLTAAHAAVTLRALTGADVVLFVSDAGQEYSAPELDFLRQAVDLCPIVLGALTKVDFYPHWRRILDLDRQHLRRAGLDVPLLPLSAPLRRHGLRAGDRTLVTESGYPWLSALLRRSADTAAAATRAGAAAAAHSALAQLTAQVAAEVDALGDPAGQEDRRARWSQARRRAEELKGAGSRWQQVLADRIGDLASDIDHDLGVRLRGIRKQAVDRITADDPSRTWGQLQPWLYQTTNEALLDHVRSIRERADAVADEVARQFGSAAWELGVTVEVTGSPAATRDVELAAVAADRSARLQVGLLAARGASTGAVVTHTVGLVLGLALPATLPATALVAAVLARKSWRTAQQSQVRAVRAEAERAVMTYLGEVEAIARKHSRDTVRQVHRQLRDVFAERAAELYATTVRTAQSLAKQVQQDEQTRAGELERLTGELHRMRELTAAAGAQLDGSLPGGRAG